MKTALEFSRALWSMPIGWRIWLAWLGGVNLISPLFFWDRIEAKATLLAMVVAFVVGVTLFRITGFTRLLGAMHFGWFALIPYLWLQRTTVPPSGFRVWLYTIIVTNSICLVIDVVDVFRYAAGDRQASTNTSSSWSGH